MSDVLDLDIHGLAIEVWPGTERIVKMRFPVGTDLSDDWTLTVPHARGDDFAIDGEVGESGEEDADGPRPQVSFTLPPERMRDIMRRSFVIAVAGVPKISGPIRVANIQSTPGETTVSITLVEPQALDVSLTVVGGGASSQAIASCILYVASLTPGSGDPVLRVGYRPDHNAEVEGLAPGWEVLAEHEWGGEEWDAAAGSHVLLITPEEWYPIAYATATADGFVPVDLPGGGLVSVACGGVGSGPGWHQGVWAGWNFDDPLTGGPSADAPAGFFAPIGVNARDVDVDGTPLDEVLANLPDGGGDVYLAVANMFTAMQSIGVDVPVTPIADAGTVKPTTLVHLHDDEGPRIDLWGSSIDFGGGIIVSSAGRLTRRIGFDGEPTDTYLLESYAFVGISETTSEPLYRLVMGEIESTDPGEMPWLADLFDVTLAPVRVGDGVEADDAITKRQLDAKVVAVGPTPPPEPADAGTAVWVRTAGDLRVFADFRLFPDGPINGVDANGAGGSIAPAPLIRSFLDLYPTFGGVAPVVTDGVVRSTGVAVDGDDPTPRTGFTFEGVVPGTSGRAEWGFGGYIETDGTFTTYSPTNIGISAPFDDLPPEAVGPDAYLGGFVVGRFVGDTDATDPGQPVSWRCKVIRDDLGAPTTIGTAALPRTPVRGDRVAFTWTAAGRFGVEFNGVEIVTATDITHDLTEFTDIGMVMHQGSDGAHTWEDAWYCGVEWFGISAGDQITGDLGPHQWTDTAGWQPIGPGARPALNAVAGGGAVTSVNGETGAVTLSAADVGAPTIAALADLSGVNPALTATARGNLNLGALAVKSAIDRTDMASGIVDTDKLDPAIIAILDLVGSSVRATSNSAARTTQTVSPDGVLEFTGVAGKVYWIDGYMILQGDAAADAKVTMTIPGGTMHIKVQHALPTIASSNDYDRQTNLAASGNSAVVGIPGPSTPVAVTFSGMVALTSDGTVAIGWAANGAGGTGITRLANSFLRHGLLA